MSTAAAEFPAFEEPREQPEAVVVNMSGELVHGDFNAPASTAEQALDTEYFIEQQDVLPDVPALHNRHLIGRIIAPVALTAAGLGLVIPNIDSQQEFNTPARVGVYLIGGGIFFWIIRAVRDDLRPHPYGREHIQDNTKTRP